MADSDLEEFILHLNRDAMTYLKEENYTLALKTLKDADKMLKTIDSSLNPKLQGITLNNFGCFYKRINKPNVALKFLKKACEKESAEPVDHVNLAGTLLNICAIYSQLGKHEMALENGCKALQLVENCEISSPNLISTLIIGYHNTGVEYEFLNCLRQAVECYKSAWSFAAKQLGENNSLSQSMHKSYIEALSKLEKSDFRASLREQYRITSQIQSQEKKPGTALPSIKKQAETNPYVAKKIQQKLPRPKKEAPKGFADNACDLTQIRFLTGDRLQPMNKQKNNSLKPGSVDPRARTAYVTSDFKSINLNSEQKSKRNKPPKPIRMREEEKPGLEESSHVRTSSAPVSIDVSHLQNRIKNLENRYEDFDKKVKPMKDFLPDLENYKFDKIAAFYQSEKKKNKDNADERKENAEGEGEGAYFDENLLKLQLKLMDEGKGSAEEFSKLSAIQERNQDFGLGDEEEVQDEDRSNKSINIKNVDFLALARESDGNPPNLSKPQKDAKIAAKSWSKSGQPQKIPSKAQVKPTEAPSRSTKASAKLKPDPIKDQTLEFPVPSPAQDLNIISEAALEWSPGLQPQRASPLIATQALFRGFLSRKAISHFESAVIFIQKNIRKHQCKSIYKGIKAAIIFIQRCYKGYRARKQIKNIKNNLMS